MLSPGLRRFRINRNFQRFSELPHEKGGEFVTSVKELVLGWYGTLANAEGCYLKLVTAYGIIQGQPEDETLNVIAKTLSKVDSEQPKTINGFSIIALKDAEIIQYGNPNVVMKIPSITVFPDQIIAVYVGGKETLERLEVR